MGPSCEQGRGVLAVVGAVPDGGPLSSLQVMYFSSLFPYVVLACFLVRGLLLRGAIDGILHMFTPKVRLCGVHMGRGGTLAAPLGLLRCTQLYTQIQLFDRCFLCFVLQRSPRKGSRLCPHVSRRGTLLQFG